MLRRELVMNGERVEVRLLDDEHSEPGCIVLEREDQAVKNKIAKCAARWSMAANRDDAEGLLRWSREWAARSCRPAMKKGLREGLRKKPLTGRGARRTMLSQLLAWFRQGHIRMCPHPAPWIILARSENIWWRAVFDLEFYEGEEPPSPLPLVNGWCHARIIKCRKCGGTLNEITLGKRWLKAKRLGMLGQPGYTVREMALGCGTITLPL